MTTGTRRGCDPRTSFPNGVDVLSSEGDLRLLDDLPERLGLLTSSDPVEMREAALDNDQAADKSTKHGSVEHRDGGRVRDVTNEEPLQGSRGCRITDKQDYRDGGNACKEGEGHPEKPVDTTEGYRPS